MYHVLLSQLRKQNHRTRYCPCRRDTVSHNLLYVCELRHMFDAYSQPAVHVLKVNLKKKKIYNTVKIAFSLSKYLKIAFRISRRNDSGFLWFFLWPLSHKALSTQWWPCLPCLKDDCITSCDGYTRFRFGFAFYCNLTLLRMFQFSGTIDVASLGDAPESIYPPGEYARRYFAFRIPGSNVCW